MTVAERRSFLVRPTVWGAESGTDRLVVIRDAAPAVSN
jgi:hypothetical protein